MENGIAMPAQAFGAYPKAYRFIIGALQDQILRQRRRAAAEPSIDLLKRHHIGVHFVEDIENTAGIAPPIRADALADIVGRNRDH